MPELIVSGSYYAKAYYTGDGERTAFTVPFPYIARDHVHLFVAGHETSFDWNDDGTLLAWGGPPASGDTVEVRRITPRDHTLVEHKDNLILTAHSLNLQDIQFLYLLQEDMDAVTDIIIAVKALEASGGSGEGGGGTGGGGGTLPPVEIDLDALREEIMEEVLRKIAEADTTMNQNLEELSRRITEGLERLKQLNLDMFRTAGFVVDEEAGTITLSALEDLRTDVGGRFNDVWATLNAHEAAINLGASTGEATEILNRLSQVEADLNAANGRIDLNASVTEQSIDDLSMRLNEAFLTLDALEGEISLCARKLETEGLETRLHNAEIWLSAHGADVGASVIDYRGMLSSISDISKAVLENAESIAYSNEERRIKDGDILSSLAYAKSELLAYVDEQDNANAHALTELFTSRITESDNANEAARNLMAAGFTDRIDAVSTDMGALAERTTTLASKTNENTAAIQQAQRVQTDLSGQVNAMATLRLDANGRTIGYTMNNTANTGDICFTADRFYILNPNGNRNTNPFYYNSNTGTLNLQGIKVNWADIVNANISTAQIRNATIDMGQITNLRVGSLELADGSVITGKIADSAVNTQKIMPGNITAHYHAQSMDYIDYTSMPPVSDVTLASNQRISASVTWTQENDDSEILFFITSTLTSTNGNKHFMAHVVQEGPDTGRVKDIVNYRNAIRVTRDISGMTTKDAYPMTSIASVSHGHKGSEFTAYITCAKSDNNEMAIGMRSFTIIEFMR